MASKINFEDTITVSTLRGMIHPLFINLTWMEWMRLSTGDPDHRTTRVLVQIFGEILELFTSKVLDCLPKDKCSTEVITAFVGNKVPEAFAKVAMVYGDFSTEHTDRLNQLIVKYVVDRVSCTSDSSDPTRSILMNAMVEETKLIVKDLFVRLHASEESKSVKKTSFFSKLKDLPGKIRGFFSNFSRKHLAKVVPMPEKLQTSSTEKILTLGSEVEEKRKSAGYSGNTLKQYYKPAVEGCAEVRENSSPMAAFVHPGFLSTEDLKEEESEQEPCFDETSLVEPFVHPDDLSDVVDPEYCLSKDLQEQVLKPKQTFGVDFVLPGQLLDWEMEEFQLELWLEESAPEEGLYVIAQPGVQEFRLYPKSNDFSTTLSPIENVSEYSSDSSGISLSDGR